MHSALRSPNLLPGERKAIVQELLAQQFQFRQNTALLNGLPMPDGPGAVAAANTVAVSPPERTVAAKKPAEKKGLSNWAKAAIAAALIGTGVGLPYAGAMLLGALNPPAVVQPVEPVSPVKPAEPVPSGNLLVELEKRGYSVAPTDLGTDIRRAFELNPALRAQLLEDVQRTLEASGVEPRTNGS